MPGRRHIALAGLTLGVMLGGAACSESPSSETQPDRTMVPGHDPLADAPQAWPEFLAWAGSELAKLPPAVPLPAEMVLPEPKWPVLRLDEKLGRATVRCEWQPAETATGTLAALGPFHSALPEPNLTVEAKTGGLEPGVLMTIRGFRVQREQVGSIAVELRQPCGEHFELRWSRAGRIRVPIPDNQRFWTLNIATDGFAEWAGPLTSISLRTDGIGKEPVEIEAVERADLRGHRRRTEQVRLTVESLTLEVPDRQERDRDPEKRQELPRASAANECVSGQEREKRYREVLGQSRQSGQDAGEEEDEVRPTVESLDPQEDRPEHERGHHDVAHEIGG